MNSARGWDVLLYAQVDVLAIIVISCLTLLLWIYRKRSGNRIQFHVRAVVFLYIGYLLSDIVCIALEFSPESPLSVKYLFNGIYFIFLLLAAYFWFENVCLELGFGDFRNNGIIAWMSRIPVAIAIIFVLTAGNNKLLFRVDPVNGYSRGPWFGLFIIVHYGYIIIASVIALVSSMNHRNVSRSYGTFVLIVYCIPVVIAGVLQYFSRGNYQAVGFATSICILFVYRILHESFSMMKILQSVTMDYSCVYLCDPSYGSITSYRVDKDFFKLESKLGIFERAHTRVHYPEFLNDFIKNCVASDSVHELEICMQMDDVVERLKKEPIFTHKYINDAGHYCELQFSTIQSGDGSFVLAIADKDEQIKNDNFMRAKLLEANRLANTDALTGVRSTQAYAKQIELIDAQIAEGKAGRFAVIEVDINKLKAVNDARGHEVGDMYIKNSALVICSIFKNSSVYRTGGDEFVLIVKGQDYEDRVVLIDQLRSQVTLPSEAVSVLGNGPSLAAGMSTFRMSDDKAFRDVFKRADTDMYTKKPSR